MAYDGPFAHPVKTGGTGRATLTNHSVIVGAGTTAVSQVGPTATAGQVLQSAGAAADPAYSTPTYPSASGSAGVILRSDGTNNVYTTATYPATTSVSQLLYSSSANVIAGLTTANNGLLVTSNTGVPSILAGPGTTGQVLQANAAAAPSFSTATFPSTATSTGTILRADGTNWVATTSTYPNTNAVSTLLYASASNVMSALATANDGLLVTSNTGVPSILAGPGTTGNVLQSNAAAAPSFSTATYPSTATGTGTILRADGTNWVATTATYPATTTINQVLYSSSNNVVAGLSTANQGVLTTGTTGIPVITAIATNGQLIIGSTAGAPAAATLTPGAGISITNGSNTISIATTGASGGGLVWTDVTGASQTVAAGNGYIADRGGGVAFTLPASGTIGDVFAIVGLQGSWTLAQAANQQIKFGSKATTVGATGSLASTDAGDCIMCVATNTSASTVWRVMNSVGNITVA